MLNVFQHLKEILKQVQNDKPLFALNDKLLFAFEEVIDRFKKQIWLG